MFLKMLEWGMRYKKTNNPLKKTLAIVFLKISSWEANRLERRAKNQKDVLINLDSEKLLKSIENKIIQRKSDSIPLDKRQQNQVPKDRTDSH